MPWQKKMATEKAQEIYKLRKQIIEPVFGDIKENKGMRGFLTRGLKTVKGEFNLICAAVNIKRILVRLKENNGSPDGFSTLVLGHQVPLPYSR
jgi:transposase